jgi:hypothetical protein
MDADRIVESILRPTVTAGAGVSTLPKPDPTRIAEAVDFQSIDAKIDDLVQGAIAQLQDTAKRGGGKSADYKNVDMGPMVNEVNAVRSQRTVANLQAAEGQRAMGVATEEEKKALKAKGQAEADQAMAENARAERESAIYNSLATSMGVRPEDVALVAGRISQMRPGVEAKLREVQKLQSVGPLDNPFNWLFNQLQLPSKINDYNAEATAMNSLEASVNDSIQMAQATASFAGKGIPTVTADMARAKAQLAKANADKAAADADEALAKTNVQFANFKLANDVHAATVTQHMTQLQIEQSKAELQAALHNINIADNNATRLLKAAELLEKIEKTKGLDVLLKNYDRVMGHPEGTTTRYNFERFGEPQRQNIVAIGAGSLGPTNDPLSSLEIFQVSRPGVGISKETRGFVNYLQGIKEGFLTDNRLQTIHGKDEQRAFVSAGMKTRVAEDIRKASATDSVFHELSPAVMLAAPGAIDPKSVTAQILEPYTKQTGNMPTEMVTAAFIGKFANPVEAGAAIADYYKKNMLIRNTYMNAKLFGIVLPETYHMRRSTSMLTGGTITENYGGSVSYDLTDPAEATKYVLRKRMDEALLRGMAGNPHVLPMGEENQFLQGAP